MRIIYYEKLYNQNYMYVYTYNIYDNVITKKAQTVLYGFVS